MATQGVQCETVRDGFVGELTEAALRVASRHGVNGFSVDQEIGLWQRLGEVVRRLTDGRTDDTEALRTRAGQLEQQVLDLRQELEERTDDLNAARAANRDLMTLANRKPASPS